MTFCAKLKDTPGAKHVCSIILLYVFNNANLRNKCKIVMNQTKNITFNWQLPFLLLFSRELVFLRYFLRAFSILRFPHFPTLIPLPSRIFFFRFDMTWSLLVLTKRSTKHRDIWEDYRTHKGLYGSHQDAVWMRVR